MRVIVGGLALDLTDDQVADLRAQLAVDFPGAGKMLTTAEAAARLGVSPDFMREHAAELGGIKLSNGPKAPWRFDPEALGKNVADSATFRLAGDSATSAQRRRPPRRAGTGQLLQSRGKAA